MPEVTTQDHTDYTVLYTVSGWFASQCAEQIVARYIPGQGLRPLGITTAAFDRAEAALYVLAGDGTLLGAVSLDDVSDVLEVDASTLRLCLEDEGWLEFSAR